MAERLVSAMKWMCCLFVVHSVSGWWSVSGVTIKPVPVPSGIEAQAKFFQYRHLPTSEDFDQGHRLGSERHFVERHERSRPAKGLFSAKVRWGDKNGGYGEHYWDLNHAGNTGSHGSNDYNDDDGSYHEDPSDSYNDHGEDSHNYDPDSYSSEEVPQYEESGRAKRAHNRSNNKVTTQKDENNEDEYEEPPRRKQRKNRKNKYYKEREEEIDEDEDHDEEEVEATTKSFKNKNDRDDEEVTLRPRKNVDKPKTKQSNDRHSNDRQSNDRHSNDRQSNDRPSNDRPSNDRLSNDRHSNDRQSNDRQSNDRQPDQNSETKDIDQRPQEREKNHFVLVVNQKEKQEDKPKQEQTEPNRLVNYEGGSGVRHYSSEAVPSASVPRLFLEAQTGHIVDRMTGQAYVLQPVVPSNSYN